MISSFTDTSRKLTTFYYLIHRRAMIDSLTCNRVHIQCTTFWLHKMKMMFISLFSECFLGKMPELLIDHNSNFVCYILYIKLPDSCIILMIMWLCLLLIDSLYVSLMYFFNDVEEYIVFCSRSACYNFSCSGHYQKEFERLCF